MSRRRITHFRTSTHSHRRRGSLYSLVLLNALLVSVIGMSAISLTRLNSLTMSQKSQAVEAEILAQTAAERALQLIKDNSSWRTTYTHNVEAGSMNLGKGTISFKLVDLDGDLQDDQQDEVTVIGIGRVGSTAFAHSVDYGRSQLTPYECLNSVLHSQQDMTINSTTVNSSGVLSSDNNVTANAAEVNGLVEARLSVNGGQYNSTTTTGVQNKTEPTNTTFFTEYTDLGTEIPLTTLPYETGTSSYLIQDTLLTAGHNTLNPALLNSNGIYYINCQGQNVRIRQSRLVATLVLQNAGTVTLEQNLHWQSHLSTYPALLVEGSCVMQFDSSGPLSEQPVNFNPPGSPWQGSYDNDTSDTYPSKLEGLVFISQNLTLQTATCEINGCVVCRQSITLSSASVTLGYRDTWLNDPPPGFGTPSGAMAVDSTSWRRAALAP